LPKSAKSAATALTASLCEMLISNYVYAYITHYNYMRYGL